MEPHTLPLVDEAAAFTTLSRWAARWAARKKWHFKCSQSAVPPPAAELSAPNISLQLQQMQKQIQQQMQQQKQQMQEQMQQMQMQMQMQLHRWEAPPDDQHAARGKTDLPACRGPPGRYDIDSSEIRRPKRCEFRPPE